jgi:hypothetical protein
VRLMLGALLLTAAPLAAQSARDTAEIRRVAADSGLTVARVRIVADTAWASVYKWSEHRDSRDSVTTGNTTVFRYSTSVSPWIVGVERRKGKWVAINRLSR